MNAVEFSKQLGALVRGTVAKAVDAFAAQLSTLSDRITALENMPVGKDGVDGRDGIDGQDGATPTEQELSALVANHLQANPPPAGKDGVDGKDGQDGVTPTPELLHVIVGEHLAANPPLPGNDGKDGVDGQDGQDAPAPTFETVAQAFAADPVVLQAAVDAHLSANPPAAGKDGVDGKDGIDGQDAPAPTADAVAAALAAAPNLLAGAVAAHLEANPVPAGQDGADGKDGQDATQDMVDASVAKYLTANPPAAGKDGIDGIDGKSIQLDDVVKQLDSMQATWAFDFERRAMALFQKAIDRMPLPTNGLDGLGFDDLTVEHDGERVVKFVFARGDQRKEFAVRVPALIHRGVYKKDALYEEGDVTTWGGSMWLAKCVTEGQQPGTDSSWQLVVKRGNDGKDK